MKLKFLCGTHRAELTRNPQRAIDYWQEGFDTGQNLSDQGMWQDAIPYLGCAFETSEILLTAKIVESQCACEIFTSSASFLMGAFRSLGYIDQCKEIYWMTVERLTREVSIHPEIQSYIVQYLERLYRENQDICLQKERANLGKPSQRPCSSYQAVIH